MQPVRNMSDKGQLRVSQVNQPPVYKDEDWPDEQQPTVAETREAAVTPQMITDRIERMNEKEKELSEVGEKVIKDAQEVAVEALQGTATGIMAVQEAISIPTEFLLKAGKAQISKRLIRTINSHAGEIASPVLAGLKLATVPIEFVITKKTKETLDGYLEGLQKSLTAVPTDRQWIEDLTAKLKDPKTSFEDIARGVDAALNDERSEGLPRFSISKHMHPKLSDDKISALDPQKEKKLLLNLISSESGCQYLLDRRNDALTHSSRKFLINQLSSGHLVIEDKLGYVMALQNRYIHEFVKAEDLEGNEPIDINNLEAVTEKMKTDPGFAEKVNERIDLFIVNLSSDSAFIKEFNTRFAGYNDRVHGLEQMLERRKEAAQKKFDVFISNMLAKSEDAQIGFAELQREFDRHGIDLTEMSIDNTEGLIASLNDPKTKAELFRQFRDPSEALLISSRNGLKALSIEKATAAKKFFEFNWLKARVMTPLEIISSTFTLIFGILVLASAVAAPPLFVTIIGSTVMAIGIGFMIAGFIHELRHNPRSFYEKTLKLRSIRKWYREKRVQALEIKTNIRSTEFEIKALVNDMISIRLDGQTYTDEQKAKLKEIEKTIPKKLRTVLLDDAPLSEAQRASLENKQQAYINKITNLEKQLEQLKIELEYQENELKVHSRALSDAGLKDAIHGGLSFKKIFGFEPWKHENSKALAIVFPELAREQMENTPDISKEIKSEQTGEPPQRNVMLPIDVDDDEILMAIEEKPQSSKGLNLNVPLGLIEALVKLESDKQLDEETKTFLEGQLSFDLKMLKEEGKTRDELAQCFSGGVAAIREIMNKRSRQKS